MRSSDHITLLRGRHEEYLEEITDAWPHVLEYVELDRYPHRSRTWHWHQEVELFYVKSGSLEYQTLRGCESFGAGSAGFVNAGVYHMTRALELIQRSCGLSPEDDAAYELRLRSLLSEIGSLSWKGPSRSWSAVLPRTPRTETSALRRCATSCTPTTPSLSRPRTLRRRAA